MRLKLTPASRWANIATNAELPQECEWTWVKPVALIKATSRTEIKMSMRLAKSLLGGHPSKAELNALHHETGLYPKHFCKNLEGVNHPDFR